MSKLFENTQDQESSQATSNALPVNAETGLLDWTQGLGNQGMLERLGLAGEACWGEEPVPYVSHPQPLIVGRAARALDQEWKETQERMLTRYTKGFLLPNPPGSVRVAQLPVSCERVLELVWHPRWGPRPTHTDVGEWTQPVGACMALGRVRRLSGWSQLTEVEQKKLEALFGGETNAVSEHAGEVLMSRVQDGLMEMDAAAQAEQLRGFLTNKRDVPWNVWQGRVLEEQASYSLRGPEPEPDFQFQESTGDAEWWELEFEDGQVVDVYAPASEEGCGYYQWDVIDVSEALSAVPVDMRRLLHVIVFDQSAPSSDPPASYMKTDMKVFEGGAVVVQPYRMPGLGAKRTVPEIKLNLIHEAAHVWAWKRWGLDSSGEAWDEWREAIEADAFRLTSYAHHSIEEDLCETMVAWRSTLGTETHEEYRAMVPARFRILDRESP
ncbi:MAG: hypothetical protein H6741_16050 [Alphaproteobacteria bacterium]|nr:hypothetical protein [Alphaproteobacteria bacterium]MCB9794227.1 hypothetical protein [Alphaproteobacteria bacterium]